MPTPESIERVLHQPLPGLPAQVRMAPIPRPLYPPTPEHRPREGGVLLLLFPAAPGLELHLVLTRRTDTVGSHKGQISFPGGRVDLGDASPAQAAVREACEEIGVCTDELRILGALTPLYIPPSDYTIYPFVAYLPRRPSFHPHPGEVAELLEIPVGYFQDDRNVQIEDWIIRDEPRRVPFFEVRGHKVWGATAMVLAEFAEVVQAAQGTA
jgi:8-oxo-dGTP pyrophosphatase MutT (NUDIX family)